MQIPSRPLHASATHLPDLKHLSSLVGGSKRRRPALGDDDEQLAGAGESAPWREEQRSDIAHRCRVAAADGGAIVGVGPKSTVCQRSFGPTPAVELTTPLPAPSRDKKHPHFQFARCILGAPRYFAWVTMSSLPTVR